MAVFERFGGMSMGELMLNLPFHLPENLLLLGRTVAILSGMCAGLDPEFDLWSSIGPYANQLISDEGGSTWETLLSEGTKLFQTAIGRITSGLVIAALLIAGVIVYGTDPGFGRVLMGASVVPLVGIMMGGRGRHPGR